MKYRKKVVVDAFRLGEEWPDWWDDAISANIIIIHYDDPRWAGLDRVDIKTLEGTMTAHRGDWIVRGIKGEIYAIKADIFEATYEPA